MQTKPIVFVSSTIRDLVNERVAAKRAIEKIPAIPRLSEYNFEAQNKPSREVCVSEVKKADIYLLVLGGSYGTVFEDGKSITEFEWETACDAGKPVLVFNTTYTKEEKQGEFAKRVGDFKGGRFYKTVTNAFELEEAIENAIRKLIQEEQFRIKADTETVFANLLEISFPDIVYIGDWNFKRDEVIELSKQSPRPLRMNATARDVVQEALRQKGLKFSSDWMTYENKILTFHDLRDMALPLSAIVDQGTVGWHRVKDYCAINDDHERYFKSLLRFCLQQKLFKMTIKWWHEDNLFVFMPSDEKKPRIRREKWHSRKDATRVVFEPKKKKSAPGEISYCRHLAFSCRFEHLDGKWYVSLTPDWFITYPSKDGLGLKKSRFGSTRVSYLKRKENNQAVFNHLKFLTYKLSFGDTTTLFRERYQFLSFGKLKSFEAYPTLVDDSWVKKEGRSIQAKLKDDQSSLPLPF